MVVFWRAATCLFLSDLLSFDYFICNLEPDIWKGPLMMHSCLLFVLVFYLFLSMLTSCLLCPWLFSFLSFSPPHHIFLISVGALRLVRSFRPPLTRAHLELNLSELCCVTPAIRITFGFPFCIGLQWELFQTSAEPCASSQPGQFFSKQMWLSNVTRQRGCDSDCSSPLESHWYHNPKNIKL